MFGWRRFWWKLFGASMGSNVLIRPGAKVTYPWKLVIGDWCWIGDNVELYSLGEIVIGSNTVISQYSYLCAGSHDYTKIGFPLTQNRITIEDQVWISSHCFIGPDVTVRKGAVVGAGSVVTRDIPAEFVCVGNPCKPVKKRMVDECVS